MVFGFCALAERGFGPRLVRTGFYMGNAPSVSFLCTTGSVIDRHGCLSVGELQRCVRAVRGTDLCNGRPPALVRASRVLWCGSRGREPVRCCGGRVSTYGLVGLAWPLVVPARGRCGLRR